MKRITEGGDISFNISSVRGLGETYTIKFYTVSIVDFIQKSNDDAVDGIIALNWDELEQLGSGVLNYTVENKISNPDYDDSTFNQTFSRTTDYYIVSSYITPDGGSSSAVITELRNKLESEITRSKEIDNTHSEQIQEITGSTNTLKREMTDLQNSVYSKAEVDELIEGIETGEINIGIIDNLNSENANKALSAKQGNVIKAAIEQLRNAIADIAYTNAAPEFSWEGSTPVVYHNVSLNLTHLTFTGISTVEDGQTWTGTLVADSGYDLPETLTSITGTYDNYTYSNGVITITNVTSDVTITASSVEQITPVVTHNVSWNLTNLTMVGSSTVEDGQTWTGTISADSGYDLPATLTNVSGTHGTVNYNSVNGSISIDSVTSDIVITASGIEQEDETDYVQNGLVLHLDGLNQGNTAGHWIDTVGNHDFVFEGGANAVSNGVEFLTSDDDAAVCEDEYDIEYTQGTIEVCFTPGPDFDTENRSFFVTNKENQLCAMYQTKTKNWIFGIYKTAGKTIPAKRILQDIDFTKPMTISENNDILIQNGVANNNTLGNARLAFDDYHSMRVGSAKPNNTLWPSHAGATIHEIRIYNRKLTQSEMLRNQRIDNNRYNLGLTI